MEIQCACYAHRLVCCFLLGLSIKMKKIALIFSGGPDKVSGPKNSITLLADALSTLGAFVSVFSVSAKKRFVFNGVEVGVFSYGRMKDFDIIIFSGVYHYKYPIVAEYATRKGIPYGISPRSSLMITSLKRSSLKKKLFLSFYGRRFLKKSVFFHFLSREERENSLRINNNSLVCPNVLKEAPCYNIKNKGKVIGFLGRYDVDHKGLDRLMAALVLIKDDMISQGFTVEFHGPDFRGGRKYLEDFVRENSLQSFVSVGGPLFGVEKNKFFDRVSIFIHTSRYEGLPQSVMEAMARGCAIAVTRGTNMCNAVEDGRCGILLEDDPTEISQQLKGLVYNFSLVEKCGVNSNFYAKENYSSDRVARRMLEKIEEAAELKK